MTISSLGLNIKNDFSENVGIELGNTSERGLVPGICRLLTPTGL